MSAKKNTSLERISAPIGVIAETITILAIAFGLGYWKCSIDRRLEAMEVAQRYNKELAKMKIEHNRQLLETEAELNSKILQLQTEIQFLKAKEK